MTAISSKFKPTTSTCMLVVLSETSMKILSPVSNPVPAGETNNRWMHRFTHTPYACIYRTHTQTIFTIGTSVYGLYNAMYNRYYDSRQESRKRNSRLNQQLTRVRIIGFTTIKQDLVLQAVKLIYTNRQAFFSLFFFIFCDGTNKT